MADMMQAPVLSVRPQAVEIRQNQDSYKMIHMATKLIGEVRLCRYWLEELNRSGQHKISSKKIIVVKTCTNLDPNLPQVPFKVACNTRKNPHQCFAFSLACKLSIPLEMIEGTFTIPANLQVVISQPEYVPDATPNINELSVWSETWDMSGGSMDANRHLAKEMLKMSDDELRDWWQKAVRAGECNFVIAQSKIYINCDPRTMQQFQVQMPKGKLVRYQLVYRYTEHLVLLDDQHQLPNPTIVRLQNTVLE